MVVIRLIGGLASQLHKYAVIKCICDENKQDFKVDLSFFNDRAFNANNIMAYGLPKLGINPQIASKEDIAKAKGYNFLSNLIFRLLTWRLPNKYTNDFFERIFYKLESYSFYRKFSSKSYLVVHVSKSTDTRWIKDINNKKDCYVYGEFGIWFEEIEAIRKELSECILNASISDHANSYKQMILSEGSSVAVHVRRGDYVSDKDANRFHGVCPIEYYKNSVTLITERNENARLFLFSDDPEWVKRNFSDFIPENTVFVSGNEGFEDFILMTTCKSHIIANSGFSSMAAWLSLAPNKNIYSPKRWFLDNETNRNQVSLLPIDWNYI